MNDHVTNSSLDNLTIKLSSKNLYVHVHGVIQHGELIHSLER